MMRPYLTIVQALEHNAGRRDSGFTHVAAGSTRFGSFHELHRNAARIAKALQHHGFARGDRLGLILSDSREFVDSLFGAFLAGVVAVPLSFPVIGKPDAYLRRLVPTVAKARTRLVLIDVGLRSFLTSGPRDLHLGATSTLDELCSEIEEEPSYAASDVRPDDSAVLQFTSGSTSEPKGVRVSHGNLVANVHAMSVALQCNPTDYSISWLPLFHDMGLIAKVLMPLYVGMRGGLFMSPRLFLEDPISWLRQISQRRGTLTFAPNFAYSLTAARATETAVRALDLSCLRVAACAAEPIRFQVLSSFANAFAPCGLRPEALVPCYGLAEHTLGATISPYGTGVTVDEISATDLTHGFAVPSRAEPGRSHDVVHVVSCGRFLVGHAGKIVDPSGVELPERALGEIWLHGPSVMQDYFEDPTSTDATLTNGWLRTGDLGYLANGNLYVCGRAKDVIILYGRKYHPQDLEWEAEQVAGIRPGCVVAFGRENPALGRDEVIVAAETKLPSERYEELQALIRGRLRQELVITVDEVHLVPPHTLPKTSSGKLQRSSARALFPRHLQPQAK